MTPPPKYIEMHYEDGEQIPSYLHAVLLEDSSYISKYSGHKIQRAKYKIINPEYIKWFNDIRWQLFVVCHTGIAADFETTCCAVART